jgi:F-type H+-transporting ATPase subunit epsilon
VTGFVLHLEGGTRYERIADVESFVGEDTSGQFGLLASHERFVTALKPALARFRCAGGSWQYLALPGGALYFAADELHISTGRYEKGGDYKTMRTRLRERLNEEERELRALRTSVRRLEDEMLRRLYELQRRGMPR